MSLNQCNIVKDLLPLYAEKIASEDTAVFVEEHLSSCIACKDELEKIKKNTVDSQCKETLPLQTIKKRLRAKKYTAVCCTAAFLLAVMLSAFAFLTAPDYLPYSAQLLSVSEKPDGSVTVLFDSQITGYDCEYTKMEETGTPVYIISAWNTIWDRWFSQRGRQNAVLPFKGDTPAVFYAENNGSENILLYGTASNSGNVTTLPRLVLGYYLLLAAFAAGGLAVLCVLFRRKEQVRKWLERAALLPVCYLLGHLCTKGFTVATYSSQRDFFFIIFVALLFYCALLFGLTLYRNYLAASKPA